LKTELSTNEGASITYAAEQLAAEVIRYHRLSAPVVWIEHHPPETTDGSMETFDLANFSSYEVAERGPYLGETRLTFGEATCKRITRGMVEASSARRCRASTNHPCSRNHTGEVGVGAGPEGKG
jgi:hypothetical protein